MADLHLHTTESDGTWTPAQVVQQATKLGLEAIAITDHDTTDGIAEAMANAPDNLEVIPGIELSTAGPSGEEIHILGLWIDPDFPELQDKLISLRLERFERTNKILQRLHEMGIDLTAEEVQRYAHKDVLSRSHIASALLAKGIVATKKEAFDTLIGQGAPAYIERKKLSPESAIRLILKASGVPVLAHPGMAGNLSFLPSLVEAGLIGLEVIHSSHTPKQEKEFLELAQQYGLLPSGGSDCHGPGGKDTIFIGKFTIPMEWVEELAAKKNS